MCAWCRTKAIITNATKLFAKQSFNFMKRNINDKQFETRDNRNVKTRARRILNMKSIVTKEAIGCIVCIVVKQILAHYLNHMA